MFRAKVGKDCSLLWNILTSNIQQLTDKYFETFITSLPPNFSFVSLTGPHVVWSDTVLHYPTALPELWMERLSSSLWPEPCSHCRTLDVTYSPLLGGLNKQLAFISMYMQEKKKIPSTMKYNLCECSHSLRLTY